LDLMEGFRPRAHEIVQDVAAIRALAGQKRLLDQV
jgi:hypothetical protein